MYPSKIIAVALLTFLQLIWPFGPQKKITLAIIDELVQGKMNRLINRANLLFSLETILGLNIDSKELTVEKLKKTAAIDKV